MISFGGTGVDWRCDDDDRTGVLVDRGPREEGLERLADAPAPGRSGMGGGWSDKPAEVGVAGPRGVVVVGVRGGMGGGSSDSVTRLGRVDVRSLSDDSVRGSGVVLLWRGNEANLLVGTELD